MGLDALALTFEQLVPKLGEPVAVQRQVEFTLAPGLEWTILGYLDLETRGRTVTGEEIERVVDYKVKNSHDQPGAGRPRHRRPACTSRAAGCKATRPRSSSLPRSQSRVPGASR